MKIIVATYFYKILFPEIEQRSYRAKLIINFENIKQHICKSVIKRNQLKVHFTNERNSQ